MNNNQKRAKYKEYFDRIKHLYEYSKRFGINVNKSLEEAYSDYSVFATKKRIKPENVISLVEFNNHYMFHLAYRKQFPFRYHNLIFLGKDITEEEAKIKKQEWLEFFKKRKTIKKSTDLPNNKQEPIKTELINIKSTTLAKKMLNKKTLLN